MWAFEIMALLSSIGYHNPYIGTIKLKSLDLVGTTCQKCWTVTDEQPDSAGAGALKIKGI